MAKDEEEVVTMQIKASDAEAQFKFAPEFQNLTPCAVVTKEHPTKKPAAPVKASNDTNAPSVSCKYKQWKFAPSSSPYRQSTTVISEQ